MEASFWLRGRLSHHSCATSSRLPFCSLVCTSFFLLLTQQSPSRLPHLPASSVKWSTLKKTVLLLKGVVLGPAASALEKQALRPHPNLTSLHLSKVTGGCVSTEELQGQWCLNMVVIRSFWGAFEIHKFLSICGVAPKSVIFIKQPL